MPPYLHFKHRQHRCEATAGVRAQQFELFARYPCPLRKPGVDRQAHTFVTDPFTDGAGDDIAYPDGVGDRFVGMVEGMMVSYGLDDSVRQLPRSGDFGTDIRMRKTEYGTFPLLESGGCITGE